MHPDCPHHAHALSRHPVHGHVTWRCDRCAGVWLPGAVVRGLARTPQWPAPDALRPTLLQCPDDARPLSAFRARGIELDCCTHCHGVWLDQGELEAIGAKLHQDDVGSENSEWHDDVAEGVCDVVEAVTRRGTATSQAAAEPPALPTRVSDLGAKPLELGPTATPRLPEAGGAKFDVEYDVPPPLPSATAAASVPDVDATVAAIDLGSIDASLFESAADAAGEAIGAALGFVGDIFSAL